MIKFCSQLLPFLATLIAAPVIAAPVTPTDTQNVQVAWRLLDYLAVDYTGAVKDGRIVSASEFAEMTEFSGSVVDRVKALSDNPKKADLVVEAQSFQAAVKAKSSTEDISSKAHALGAHLLAVYPVALAPAVAPEFDHGAKLFSENCASCHGVTGDGHGPASVNLDPPPIAFIDINRAKNRSVFGLYQVIGQGLDGTAMPSFAQLSDNDRWALAFYAGHFAFQDVQKGEQLWKSDETLRQHFPDLKALAGVTPSQLAAEIGPDKAYPLMAYLRTHPSVVVAQPSTLAVSHQRLNEALKAYRAGDQHQAEELALSAYLDGFEPVEPMLSARDGTLLTRIEKEMGALRASIHDHADVKIVESRFTTIQSLLGQAEKALAPEATSNTSTFVGAFTILLREGLEALLIVTAMIAFLKKAERVEALPYVHGGWIAALAAGAATWAVATFLIGISGASRELTEGFGSVLATVVLLWVGIWLHGKAQANEWQRFIKETMGHALSKGSSWFLFGLAFVVVYREVFETILFYAALWTKNNGLVILSGAGLAVIGLAVIAWAMLRFSARLPITQFFTFSSALIAVLAIVLAGKGVAALQEAGLIDVAPVAFAPQVELLGIYPTLQSLGAQLAVIAVITGAFVYSRYKNREPAAAQ